MDSNKIGQKIIQAASVLVERAIKTAGYDKTIQATILSCDDASLGKYRVRYQGGIWYAFSPPETSYSENTQVYVLVPNGDMSKQKTILGKTDDLGADYINILQEDAGYNPIGRSVIADNTNNSNGAGFCSFNGTGEYVFYDSTKSNNFLYIDPNNLLYNFKQADRFEISADFQTELLQTQKGPGNYGLKFYLKFKDNAEGNEVTRVYVLDTSDMTGSGYDYVSPTTQKAIFEIDGANFIGVSKIVGFFENFNKDTKQAKAEGMDPTLSDIFISNIGMTALEELSEEEKNGTSLSLVASKGYLFTDSIDELTVEAIVKVRLKTVNPSVQNVQYYWFEENPNIKSNNKKCTTIGGEGWNCLNNFKDNTPISNKVNYFTRKKSDVVTKEKKYKCVIIYNEQKIAKEFTLRNSKAKYTVSLSAANGRTDFAHDVGSTTLTCNVSATGENNQNINYLYRWGYYTNTAKFYSLTSQTKSISIQIKDIVNFNIYVCGVYRRDTYTENGKTKTEDTYIGSSQIKITNTLEDKSNRYSLVLENSDQIFVYNEEGDSPTSKYFDDPLKLSAINIIVYDEYGERIASNVLNSKAKIKWQLPPYDKTMLIFANRKTSTKTEDGKQIVVYENELTNNNVQTVAYTINDTYDISRSQNNVVVTVVYRGEVLTATTNFTFVKQGESGTNGTNCFTRIVPANNSLKEEYPMITIQQKTGNRTEDNKTFEAYDYNSDVVNNSSAGSTWFNVELWEKGQASTAPTFKGATSANPVTGLSWHILENPFGSGSWIRYNTSSKKLQPYIVGTVGSKIRYRLDWDQISAGKIIVNNLIENTLTYNGTQYSAVMPVIFTIKIKGFNYTAKLKYNTGFRQVIYKEDGTNPSYNNNKPFEILVYKNGQQVTNSTAEALTYKYYVTTENLKIGETSQNTVTIQPSEKFNSTKVNNALCVEVYNKNQIRILYMCIPVYCHLNKYGHSALNEWNGNSIVIKENQTDTKKRSYILAPQIGAGNKDNNDNSFTGIVMGDVYTAGARETGLFGYSQGVRSIFLDANTGNATFGISSGSQIIFEPGTGNKVGQDKAIIRSGDFSTKNKTGMEINLSTGSNEEGPYIKFGSGNFSVDKEGNITAKGGGTIAGWNIGNRSLQSVQVTNDAKKLKENVGMNSDSNSLKATFYTPTKNVEEGRAFWANDKFVVSHSGYVKMANAVIGNSSSANTRIYIGTYEKDKISYSAIFTKGHPARDSDEDGFYLGRDGLSIGSTFNVTDAGVLTATKGKIANWQIENGFLYHLFENTSYQAVIDKAKPSQIGLYLKGKKIYDEKTKKFVSAPANEPKKGAYFGQAGLWIEDNFYVDENGNLSAKNGYFNGTIKVTEGGQIANWNISEESLYTENKLFYAKQIGPDGKGLLDGDLTRTLFRPRAQGIYIGKYGIRMGPDDAKDTDLPIFYVDIDKKTSYFNGELKTESGKIANWIIEKDTLYSQAIKDNDKYYQAKQAWLIQHPDYKDSVTVLQLLADRYQFDYDEEKKIGKFITDDKGKLVRNTKDRRKSGFYIGKDGIWIQDNFQVTDEGKLTAVDGNFQGKVTAEKGKIANWTLSKESLSWSDIYYPKDRDEENFPLEEKITIGQSGISFKTRRDGSNLGFDTKFSVNHDGTVKAIKGEIGGWTLSNYALYTGKDTVAFQVKTDKDGKITYFLQDNNKLYLGNQGVRFGKVFHFFPSLKAVEYTDESGNTKTIDIPELGQAQIGPWYLSQHSIRSKGAADLFYVTKKSLSEYWEKRGSFANLTEDTSDTFDQILKDYEKGAENWRSVAENGFYIGPEGIRIGKHFYVDATGDEHKKNKKGALFIDGTINSKNGVIADWHINEHSLTWLPWTRKGHSYNKNNIDYNSDLKQVDENGVKLWEEIADKTLIKGPNQYEDSIYFGQDGLRMGQTFKVDNSGNAYFKGKIESSEGKIANWIISNNTLTSQNGTIKLNAWKNGSITIGGVTLSPSGNNASATGGSVNGLTVSGGTLRDNSKIASHTKVFSDENTDGTILDTYIQELTTNYLKVNHGLTVGADDSVGAKTAYFNGHVYFPGQIHISTGTQIEITDGGSGTNKGKTTTITFGQDGKGGTMSFTNGILVNATKGDSGIYDVS